MEEITKDLEVPDGIIPLIEMVAKKLFPPGSHISNESSEGPFGEVLNLMNQFLLGHKAQHQLLCSYMM